MKNQGNIVKFKNKNKSGILIAVLIFLAVLLLFLAVRYFIYDNFFKNKKLIINEPVNYEKKLELKGVVVRDEYVYGKMSLTQDFNEKISINTDIGTRNDLKYFLNYADINNDKILEELDKDISYYEGYLKNYRLSYSKAHRLDKNKMKEIIDNIRKGNYEQNSEIINKIKKTSTYKRQDLDNILSKLKIKREFIKNTNIKSLNSGIISSNIDGLEEVLNYECVRNYNMGDLFVAEDLKTQDIAKSFDAKNYKIINNLNWYLILSYNKDYNDNNFKIGQNVIFEVENKKIAGIVKIFDETDKIQTLILEINTDMDFVKNKRYLDLKLITKSEKAYEIPKTALVEKDGVYGVYSGFMGEKVKFKPVKIMDRLKNGKVMISCGVDVDGEEGIIFFEDKKVQTVKKYEVVYVNAEEIEEGGYIY